MYPITFPNLGIEINVSPIAFTVLGKDIYWYGIIIAMGILLSLLLVRINIGRYEIKWDDVIDFLTFAIIISIISARIYYVAFRWDYYSLHPYDIIKIWNGGIAIYGGIIGAVITAIIYCRKKKINLLKFCDFLAPYLALGQSIGRWGNFLNREAYGYETNSFFKMGLFDKSINKYIYVHPTFLYESVLTLAIFLILYFRGNKSKNDGEIFYLYMIMYGVGRAIIEGFRQDSLFLYNFRISQVIAMVFVIIFTILLYNQKAKRENT